MHGSLMVCCDLGIRLVYVLTRAERDAMGDDEYHPIGHTGSNLTAAGGIGYTVVDSLDTMIIMGLEDEYKRAREWVADKLDFEKDADFNTFEVRATSMSWSCDT